MRNLTSATVVVLLITAVFTTPGDAQEQAPSERGATSQDPMKEAASRLRQLTVAQEGYYADHGTYTTDLAALGMLVERAATQRPDYIWLQVIHAGGRSWSGAAHPRQASGKSCVAYVGRLTDFASPPSTTTDKRVPTGEGQPVCDRL